MPKMPLNEVEEVMQQHDEETVDFEACNSHYQMSAVEEAELQQGFDEFFEVAFDEAKKNPEAREMLNDIFVKHGYDEPMPRPQWLIDVIEGDRIEHLLEREGHYPPEENKPVKEISGGFLS